MVKREPMKLELDLQLFFATMNPEGGDDPAIGSSITLKGDVLVDKLEPLFQTKKRYEALLGGLYDDKDQLVPPVGQITLSIDLEGVDVEFVGLVTREQALELKGCKFREVVLSPKHGRAVGFSAKVYGHPENFDLIAAAIRKDFTVVISGGQQVQKLDKNKAAQEKLALSGGSTPKDSEAPEPAVPAVH